MNAVPVSDDLYEITLDFAEIALRREDLTAVAGYADGDVPAHFDEALDRALEEAKRLVNIRGGYRLFSTVERSPDLLRLSLEGVEFNVGKIIGIQLRKASAAAIFLCTIGDGLEGYARRVMKEGDYVTGFAVDLLASEIVERATDGVQAHLEEEMRRRGLKITNRYSPGYCGWNVVEQQKLFSLLPPVFCGVTLTDSSLMTPIKSVSGLIGIGEAVRRVDYTCRFCELQDCIYRRRRKPV